MNECHACAAGAVKIRRHGRIQHLATFGNSLWNDCAAVEDRPSHLKRCLWCEIPINELTETHVKDGGYPDQNWWHVDCWNISRQDPESDSFRRYMDMRREKAEEDTQLAPEVTPELHAGGDL